MSGASRRRVTPAREKCAVGDGGGAGSAQSGHHAVVLLLESFEEDAELTRYVAALGQALAEQGHRVALWALKGDGAALKGVEVCVEVRGFGLSLRARGAELGRCRALHRALRRFCGADEVIIQSHDAASDLVAPCLARLVSRCFAVSSRVRAGGERGAVNVLAQRLLNPWVSRVLVGSDKAKWALVRREGLAPSRIEVTADGVDVGRLRPAVTPLEKAAREALRESLCVEPDEVVLLSVGDLKVSNGHGAAIEVTARLVRQGRRVRLWLVGEGEDAALFEAQVKREGVAGRVHLLGFRDDVPALLRAADLYIQAAHIEGSSASLMAAMAAGLPAVATDVGVSREAVGEDSGVVTGVNDLGAMIAAVSMLVDEPARRLAMGVSGRAAALARYTTSQMVDRVIVAHRCALSVGPGAFE